MFTNPSQPTGDQQAIEWKKKREERAIAFFSERLSDLNRKTQFIDKLRTNFPSITKLNIVSIGFGKYPVELIALTQFLGEFGFALKYNGFEVNKKKLNFAKYQYAKNDVNFHLIDGTDYVKIREILKNEPVHIMVLRHPVLNPTWRVANAPFRSIFTQTVPYLLTPGGLLLTSIYTDPEADRMRVLFEEMGCTALELEAKENVFWKKEVSVQGGFNDSIWSSYVKRTALYAENYFFGVVDFKPNLLFRLEKVNTPFDKSKSEKLYEMLFAAINSTLEGYYSPVQKSARVNFILSTLINIVSANPTDFSNVDEKLKQALQNKTAKNFEELKNSALAHVEWAYSAWSEYPENQKILLQRIADAFVLLSESNELQQQSLSEHQSHYLQALKIVTERPLPNELPEHVEQPCERPYRPASMW